MKLMVSEVINTAHSLNKLEDKIHFLRQNDSVPLRHVLKVGLDKNIEILLPPGDPPYNPSQAVESHGMFFSQARKLYLFLKGGNDNLHPLKRETLFIQMLEAVHPEDAKMLLLMKDKKIPLSADVVNAAFPDLQIDPVVKVEEVVELDVVMKSETTDNQSSSSTKRKGKPTSKVVKAVKEVNQETDQVVETKKRPGRPKKAS